ncbi:WXG100 family type VII secretion target [Paenibacillus lautus]|uniref:WXG100 family type VII secretion target n=1 Tax=Paenibacillus lautus TaxID=1401 RepID=UPI003D2B0445
MPRILVPPEVLIRVSEEAARAAEELETTKNRLDQQITYMMSSWEGTTRSRFFEDFQHAHGEMKIINIHNTGSEKNITQMQVSPGGGRHGDSPYVKISTSDQGIIKIVDGSENVY